jgi:hypothetical protein
MCVSEAGLSEDSVILSLIREGLRRDSNRSKYWSPDAESRVRTLSMMDRSYLRISVWMSLCWVMIRLIISLASALTFCEEFKVRQ